MNKGFRLFWISYFETFSFVLDKDQSFHLSPFTVTQSQLLGNAGGRNSQTVEDLGAPFRQTQLSSRPFPKH